MAIAKFRSVRMIVAAANRMMMASRVSANGRDPATRLRMPSPDNVTEPAKLLLPRDEERTRDHVPLRDFAGPFVF